jgi:hypothetical protein
MIPPALFVLLSCRSEPEAAPPVVPEPVQDPEPSPEPTGDTGETSPEPTGDTGEPVEGILSASVGCLDADHIRAEGTAGASGPVGVLNLWETGAPQGLGWNEEHDLALSADGGDLALLARELVDVSVGGWYERNEISLFECEYQFANFAGTLTASLRVADPETGEISCVIWGHDPEMVLAGEFEEYTPVTDPASLAGCGALSGTVTSSSAAFTLGEPSPERDRAGQIAGWLGQLRYEMARAGSGCSGEALKELARGYAGVRDGLEGEGLEEGMKREVEKVAGCEGVSLELVKRLMF